MRDETAMGGSARGFPATRLSLVHGVRSPSEAERRAALGALVEAYWKPVYKHLRLRLGRDNETAKDLTQGFLAAALEKGFFAGYDPTRARFRTWIRTGLEAWAANASRAAAALKRGGGAPELSLDFAAAEEEIAHGAPQGGFAFEDEWRRGVLQAAIGDLERACSERGLALRFEAFRRHDLAEDAAARPSYADLAQALGVTVTWITNHLAAARRELRSRVIDRLRAQAATEEEFRDELRALLGTTPGPGAS